MERFQAFGKGLKLAQKTQLLQLHIGQQTVELCKLQDIQEKRSIDCDLAGCSHGLLEMYVGASL